MNTPVNRRSFLRLMDAAVPVQAAVHPVVVPVQFAEDPE